jgi:dipeptidyl-peptidase 4
MKKIFDFGSIKFSLFLSIAFCLSVNAQVSKETYKKAEYFLTNSIQKEVYNLEVIPNWIKDKNAFWHVTYTKDGKRFLLTDIAKKETKNAFDHELLSKLLNEATGG